MDEICSSNLLARCSSVTEQGLCNLNLLRNSIPSFDKYYQTDLTNPPLSPRKIRDKCWNSQQYGLWRSRSICPLTAGNSRAGPILAGSGRWQVWSVDQPMDCLLLLHYRPKDPNFDTFLWISHPTNYKPLNITHFLLICQLGDVTRSFVLFCLPFKLSGTQSIKMYLTIFALSCSWITISWKCCPR